MRLRNIATYAALIVSAGVGCSPVTELNGGPAVNSDISVDELTMRTNGGNMSCVELGQSAAVMSSDPVKLTCITPGRTYKMICRKSGLDASCEPSVR